MPAGSFGRSRSITSSYFSLMPITPRWAPTSRMADGQALQHVVGVGAEHLLVLVQQRLALGGVDQDGVGLAGQLDVGGKAGPAGPDHARLVNIFNPNGCHDHLAEGKQSLS